MEEFDQNVHGERLGLDPRMLTKTTHVYVETANLGIYAFLHHPRDKRLSEYLVEDPAFVNLTEAVIQPLDGRDVYESGHIGIRTNQIVLWMECEVNNAGDENSVDEVEEILEAADTAHHSIEASAALPLADPFAAVNQTPAS